jgi:hypothetical protein
MILIITNPPPTTPTHGNSSLCHTAEKLTITTPNKPNSHPKLDTRKRAYTITNWEEKREKKRSIKK